MDANRVIALIVDAQCLVEELRMKEQNPTERIYLSGKEVALLEVEILVRRLIAGESHII